MTDHAARIAELEQALAEQARLNGMGASREAALLARCEAAERNAARYRWLRDDVNLCHVLDEYEGEEGDGFSFKQGVLLDTAIDAAMAREGEK